MGFSFKRFIRNPVRAIVKVVKNPAKKIIPIQIRKTKIYKKIGRPIIKVGAGIALGAVTGGVGLAGFTGLSLAGAAAGGVSSALAGGLNSGGFKPIKNGLLPAAAGFVAGAAARNFSAIKAAANAAKQTGTAIVKKELARAVAKAGAAASPAALAKTAGSIAGSKLAQLAARRSSGGVATNATDQQAQQKQPVAMDAALQADKNSTKQKGNGIALATLAVVAVSALAG